MAGTLVIEGGYVVTMDAARRCFDGGFVLVRDGAVAAVGPAADAPDDADERIDARGCIVVPGLINGHQHHWYNLFRGLGRGLLLEQWIQELLVPAAAALTPPDVAAAARLSCLEMLGTGTTTCLNHSVAQTDAEWVEAALAPVVDAGMRQLFAKEVRPVGLDDQLALAAAIHARWHGAGDGRIAIGLAIETTAHWVELGHSSEELIGRGDALAAELGMRITDHVAGGTMSRERGYLRAVLETGRTDFELLHHLGVLDPKWVLAHAINATDRDIELVAASGASVVHTPTSESARGGGIARVRRFRDAGTLVALGTDGPMVDTTVDMVEQMKVAMLLQNQLHRDPVALTPDDVLAMATIDAARSLGLDDRIGSLEPGKRADIAVFDLETPHAAPWHDALVALVQSAHGTDARWVLVDGEPLVAEGTFTRHDRGDVRAIVAEARVRVDELLERASIPAHRRGAPSPLPS